MTIFGFARGLILSIIFTIILYWSLIKGFELNQFWDMFLYSSALYVTICIAIFLGTLKKNTSKNYFINLMIINVGLKLLLSLMLVVGYSRIINPDSKSFVVPFLICYLVYTCFEVYFTSHQAKAIK